MASKKLPANVSTRFSNPGVVINVVELDTLRPIEKHTAAGRTRKQDFLQKQTLPASDVDYSRKCFEVVRLQHGARVSKRIARHRTIGNGLFFGMLLAIRPRIHTMRNRVGALA